MKQKAGAKVMFDTWNDYSIGKMEAINEKK